MKNEQQGVTQVCLSELEEYHADRFVIKPVYEGAQSIAKLLHLQPGQTVPIHPHAGREVILMPQKGEAILTWEDGSEQRLIAGTVYYQGLEPTFGLKNVGDAPFQMLILLVKIVGERT